MSRPSASLSMAAIDRRTLLARAKDELTESLREHGDGEPGELQVDEVIAVADLVVRWAAVVEGVRLVVLVEQQAQLGVEGGVG